MPETIKSVQLLNFASQSTTQTGATIDLDTAEINSIDCVSLFLNVTLATAGTLDVSFQVSLDKGTTWWKIRQRWGTATPFIVTYGDFEQITITTGTYSLFQVPIPAGTTSVRAVATIGTGPYTVTLIAKFHTAYIVK